VSFIILNLAEARFDCTFGRGCDGVCCRYGRPPIYAEELAQINATLSSILPALRPEARAVVERDGFVSQRRKAGQLSARVVKGWCVFFHQGCVLHHAGIKPAVCAMFPLARDERDRWYVRQKGYRGEIWDLTCLDPAASIVPASESLREEIALVESFGE
jgi:hypothetical protein